jgi:Putative Flp pilus-assembly TadE/G-like
VGHDSPESGQAAVGLLVILALLLFAGLGLAVDMSNLWSHRQAAQSAADAACQAGAMDMLATSSGLQLNSMGFTPGTASSCSASSAATMCSYAGFNGYNGAGPQPASNLNSTWNTVSWSFPATVSGITPPPTSLTTTPYVQVSIVDSVKTYFIGLFTPSSYQQVKTTSICGLAEFKEAAPIVVLHPSMAGSLYYSGGASLNIVGGPQRSIQVNSTSATAVECLPSGVINTSQGGPNGTGSDIGVVGAETQAQAGCENSGGYQGFYGGATGNWRSSVLPVPDPYASLAPPASVQSSATRPITYVSSTQYYTWVDYHIDGCPDQDSKAPGGKTTPTNCAEFGPGYYPNGIVLPNDYSTIIFLPGVYYVNGSLASSGSNTIRNALPCWSTYTSGYSASACSPVASANGLAYSPTQGVMFYFTNSGTFSISGGQSKDLIDNVPSSALTCDGSQPSSTLNMPSAGLAGNVLWAQCTQNATYWDNGGDTTDSPGNPGNRGILMFQDHADTTSPTLSGSGELAYGGSLYFHSTNHEDVLTLSGGTGSGSYILGNIITDQIQLTGSGTIGMQLNSVPTTYMPKVATFQ